jgi:hypothetical protein
MSDELRQILLDYAMKSGAWNDKALENVDSALSAIREAIPRMVVIDKDKLANLITFELEAGGWCLMSTFLNSGDVTKVASALCEQVGELVKVKK